MKRMFICEDTITGLFSAIYDGWKCTLSGGEAGIVLKGPIEQELFCEYLETDISNKKALGIEKLIKTYLGLEAYWQIYHAALSPHADKGNAILGTLVEAKKLKNSTHIMEHLGNEKVRRVFELSRMVGNEAHQFTGFVRFRELESGILFSDIKPKSQVLTCIAEHFSNRLPLENWMIYDKTHGIFLVHQAKKRWFLILGENINFEELEKISESEQIYERLWKGFCKSISIEERESVRRQRGVLPIRFRSDMVEFSR